MAFKKKRKEKDDDVSEDTGLKIPEAPPGLIPGHGLRCVCIRCRSLRLAEDKPRA